MTENPINPAALYDYAASKNDMDSLRPEERTFLEACAWEWERLIDHGAEEWGKQFEALGIKPGVPQAPSAKPAPAAPEKPACEHGQPVSGSWGDITRPDWIDVPFKQPFATPVLMVEAAEHLRSYAVSQERCARFWREKFKQEASDHAATQGRFDSGFGKPSPRNAFLSKEDIVLALPTVDAGPLAQIHIEELHRLLAPVLDAAGFAPGQEKAENAINRLLMQWRSGLEPRVPPAPSSPAAERAPCARCGKLEDDKDNAYSERNQLVAALSKVYPSTLERHPDEDKSWDDDWRWIVFVNLPTGQATWHIHDAELPFFAHLERNTGAKWDGHSTCEKYNRLEALAAVGQRKAAAAERADEGLEEDAERLWFAWRTRENWGDVARVARALRRGGVTADLLREANDLYGKFDLASEHGSKLRLDLSERIEAHLAALDSGASVVVDREEWERTKADLERLRAFYRSVNDEIPEGLWPAATTLDAFRKLVDGYANVCADAKALHEREEERDRALADTEHRHALAERERDALAAKLEEAERALCERAEQVDKLMQERDLVMARLGNFCQPGEIEDRIRILQGHAGKMERQRDEARADAERLRSERALIAKALDAEFSSEPLWSVAERLRGELDAERESHAETHDLAYEATRTAAPTVAVTDVEKAAMTVVKKFGLGDGSLASEQSTSEGIAAILRYCTRAASVEEVAEAINAEAWKIADEPPNPEPTAESEMDEHRRFARAVLRALGVREAEKNATPPPAPAQAGWTEVAAESIVKMLRPHDGESRHRLNVEEVLDILRARAPKVRVRLPALRSYEANGESTAWKAGYNDARMECAAALRSAGVLIEGEQS